MAMTAQRERIDALSLLKQLERPRSPGAAPALDDYLELLKAKATVKHVRQLLDSIADTDIDTDDLRRRLALIEAKLSQNAGKTSRPTTPIPHLDFLAPSIPLPPPLPATSIVLPQASTQDRRASLATSSAATSPRPVAAFSDHGSTHITPPPPPPPHPASASASLPPPPPPRSSQALSPPPLPAAHRRRSPSIDDGYSPDDYSVKRPKAYVPEAVSPAPPLREDEPNYGPSFDPLPPPRRYSPSPEASFDAPLPRAPEIRVEEEEDNDQPERYPTPPPADEDDIDEESGIGGGMPLPPPPPPKTVKAAPVSPPPVKGKMVPPPPKANGPSTSTPPSTVSKGSMRHRSVIPSRRPGQHPAREKGLTSASDLSASPTNGSDVLSHHHDLQSEILSELTTLSGRLKDSSKTFSENLEKDREVVEAAKDKLEKNSDKMGKERGRLTEVRKKTRGTTCWTIGVVGAVGMAWVVMFLLIKVT